MIDHVYTVFCPFGGMGAGARGFADARVSLLGRTARFEVLGGIDFDPRACHDFELLTGVAELCADVEDLSAADIRARWPNTPSCVFMSPPCKAASKLISDAKAQEEKYRKMMRLALVWTGRMLEAWAHDLPRLVLFENVPNITTNRRGKEIVEGVQRLLRAAGYVTHTGFHDCGELGGLAQHRKRFLMVGRLAKRVPPLLYQPPKKRVRGCGEVLGELPMPEDVAAGGAMHTMPRITWLNWMRLALIPAGGDWRDLPGVLADGQQRRALFRRHRIERWDEPTATVAASHGSNGVGAVADPRVDVAVATARFHHSLKVTSWDGPAPTVTSSPAPSSGAVCIADPRIALTPNENRHWNKYAVTPWDEPARTVIGATRPGSGSANVADPRVSNAFDRGYAVLRWNEASPTVATKCSPGNGAYSVADPRLGCEPHAGAYGVLGWDEASKTITAHHKVDNSTAAVADPRVDGDVEQLGEIVDIGDPRKAPASPPLIVSADGSWHRPLTTLELAALQGLPTRINGSPLVLSGSGPTHWREAIGNAVPPPAAKAIAEQMLVTLVCADAAAFSLSSGSAVWVEAPDAVQPGRVEIVQ